MANPEDGPTITVCCSLPCLFWHAGGELRGLSVCDFVIVSQVKCTYHLNFRNSTHNLAKR